MVYRKQRPSTAVSLIISSTHFTICFPKTNRLEKERSSLSSDHHELAGQLEDLQKSKSTLEKKLRAAEEQLADTSAKVLYAVTITYMHLHLYHSWLRMKHWWQI